jgi:hypothetical protein
MRNTSLTIILLATFALTLTVPAICGISLLQQAKAETSGQNGLNGRADSTSSAKGGKGGTGNSPNSGDSFNGNGGAGGRAIQLHLLIISLLLIYFIPKKTSSSITFL